MTSFFYEHFLNRGNGKVLIPKQATGCDVNLTLKDGDKEEITFVNLPSPFAGAFINPENQDKRDLCTWTGVDALASLPLSCSR